MKLRKLQTKEIAISIILSMSMSLMLYFLLVYNALSHFNLEKQTQQTLQITLHTQLQQQADNSVVKKSLVIAAQNDPDLYHSLQSISTRETLSATLTSLIQQSGLIIAHIQTLPSQHQPIFLIQADLLGSYLSLFALLDLLSHNQWPIQITDIQIDDKRHIQLRLALKDSDA